MKLEVESYLKKLESIRLFSAAPNSLKKKIRLFLNNFSFEIFKMLNNVDLTSPAFWLGTSCGILSSVLIYRLLKKRDYSEDNEV